MKRGYLSKIFHRLLIFSPFVIVFIASLYPPADSDLGWHLKYGEYFFQHSRILRDNTFSTMMPNYHWVNSSWATDLLSYSVFHYLGFLGMTILGALVITLTFYFFAKAAKLSLWQEAFLFPLLLYFEQPVNVVSFRGQLLTFLFLGILFYLLSLYETGKSKKIFLVIPLFTLWVNFHGEYLLGLGVLTLWIFIYLAEKFFYSMKEQRSGILREAKMLSGIIILSFLATLVNPFGIGVYIESSNHFFNPWQKYVAEWLPFNELSQLWWNHIIMGTLILVGFMALFFTDKLKRNIPYLVIVLLFFALSFMMRRYAWPLYYMALPLITPLSDLFNPPDNKIRTIAVSILLILTLFIILILRYPFEQYLTMNWEKYCSDYRSCSPKAAEFLIKNNLNRDKLITLYDWGGWIIWNYPQIRPSIDGRMHLWKDEKGYSAFAEYYPIEQNWKDIDASGFNTAFMSPSKSGYDRLIELAKEGKWKLVYQDQFAGIFIRGK